VGHRAPNFGNNNSCKIRNIGGDDHFQNCAKIISRVAQEAQKMEQMRSLRCRSIILKTSIHRCRNRVSSVATNGVFPPNLAFVSEITEGFWKNQPDLFLHYQYLRHNSHNSYRHHTQRHFAFLGFSDKRSRVYFENASGNTACRSHKQITTSTTNT